MVSYNFGAKSMKRAKDTLKIAIKSSVVIGIAFYIAVFVFGEHFIELFVEGDERLTTITFEAIRVYGLSYIFIGINLLSSAYLTSLHRPKISLIVSMSYNLIFVLIGLLAFPHLFGAPGIWWAVPFANIATILISIYFVKKANKEIVENV